MTNKSSSFFSQSLLILGSGSDWSLVSNLILVLTRQWTDSGSDWSLVSNLILVLTRQWTDSGADWSLVSNLILVLTRQWTDSGADWPLVSNLILVLTSRWLVSVTASKRGQLWSPYVAESRGASARSNPPSICSCLRSRSSSSCRSAILRL